MRNGGSRRWGVSGWSAAERRNNAPAVEATFLLIIIHRSHMVDTGAGVRGERGGVRCEGWWPAKCAFAS
jgi:hypothetical protein